ncbi:MAG: phosphate acyltransferase PlsX [Bacilli bacterium]
MKKTIAVDAMGGDFAPFEIVKGVVAAAANYPNTNFILVGDKEKIEAVCAIPKEIEIVHTAEKIDSDDEPRRALRKREASMMVALNLVKEKKADACISAGNTGALMAGGLFIVGRMTGVDRPGLAPTLPTLDGKGVVMLDLGANADAKPEHLLQYALMASIYAEKVRGISSPRVGLLNIGSEKGKGNDVTKKAYELLSEAPINFIGNVEGRDLMSGSADVIVTDGFTGNVALKTMEGTALGLFDLLKAELTSTFVAKMAAAILKPKLKGIKNKLDYSEYGGALLLGLAAPVVKAHGSSKARAVESAIKQTVSMVEKDVVPTISKGIEAQVNAVTSSK